MKSIRFSARIVPAALVASLALGLSLTGAPAHADTPAVSFSAPTIDYTNNTWSLGWQFTTNQPITVTGLGFYDDEKNGLRETHDVGIFDSTETLLVSGTVQNSDPLVGFFRYTTVPDLTLAAGQTYYISATTGSENYTWNPSDFAVDPAINFVNDRYEVSTTLVFPSSGPAGVNGFFGPNFEFASASPTPEPASLAVLGAGVLPLLRRRRRLASQG